MIEKEDLQFWFDFIVENKTLGEIPEDQLDNVAGDQQSACEIYGLVCGARSAMGFDLNDLSESDDELAKKVSQVLLMFILEDARRQMAPDRPKLFFIRDLPIKEIDTSKFTEIPIREFIRGFAMQMREKSGHEINEEEAKELIKKILIEDFPVNS